MNSAFAILCCIWLIMLTYYSIKVTELSMRNLELQRRINETIEIVKSFEYYIPEDNKQELIEILRGIDEKWIE